MWGYLNPFAWFTTSNIRSESPEIIDLDVDLEVDQKYEFVFQENQANFQDRDNHISPTSPTSPISPISPTSPTSPISPILSKTGFHKSCKGGKKYRGKSQKKSHRNAHMSHMGHNQNRSAT